MPTPLQALHPTFRLLSQQKIGQTHIKTRAFTQSPLDVSFVLQHNGTAASALMLLVRVKVKGLFYQFRIIPKVHQLSVQARSLLFIIRAQLTLTLASLLLIMCQHSDCLDSSAAFRLRGHEFKVNTGSQ